MCVISVHAAKEVPENRLVFHGTEAQRRPQMCAVLKRRTR